MFLLGACFGSLGKPGGGEHTMAGSGVYSSAEGGGRGLSSPLASSRHLFLFPQKGGDPGASLLGLAFTVFADADNCAAAFSASMVFIMR